MELVFTLLAVILLVTLPVLVLLLVVGGLFYSIARAIRDERKGAARPTNQSPSATREGQLPREKAGLSNGNESKVLKQPSGVRHAPAILADLDRILIPEQR